MNAFPAGVVKRPQVKKLGQGPVLICIFLGGVHQGRVVNGVRQVCGYGARRDRNRGTCPATQPADGGMR